MRQWTMCIFAFGGGSCSNVIVNLKKILLLQTSETTFIFYPSPGRPLQAKATLEVEALAHHARSVSNGLALHIVSTVNGTAPFTAAAF